MRTALETRRLFEQVVSYRRRHVFSELGLLTTRGQFPEQPSTSKYRVQFERAARCDLRREARHCFKKLVEQPWRFQFKRGAADQEVVDRIRALKRRMGTRGWIYLFFGYRGDKRYCIYVGRTRGGGGRVTQHPEILRRNRVRQLKVFKVKNRRELGAVECLAIHGYAPLANRVNASHPRGAVKCFICRKIRKAWREFKPLVRK